MREKSILALSAFLFAAFAAGLAACSDNASPGNPGSSESSSGSGGAGSGAAGSSGGGSSGAGSGGTSTSTSGSTSGAASSTSSGGPSGSSSGAPSGGDDAGDDAGGSGGGDDASTGAGDAAGSSSGGSSSGGSGSGGGANPYGDPNLVSLFDGTTLGGWTQVPANSWTVQGGAMHALGTARGFIYTANTTYGDFRWIFTERLLAPVSHQACVLIWGDQPSADALAALQVQPPNGSMWDYRKTGPTANKSPTMFETLHMSPGLDPMQWNQCELLASASTGSFRFACCTPTGTGPCKATEELDFKDPAAVGAKGPLALQIHNSAMIVEFKDLYVESPVMDPTKLITQ